MKRHVFLAVIFWIIPCLVVLAQNTDGKLNICQKTKDCKNVIDLKNFGDNKVLLYEKGEMKDIPSETPIYLRIEDNKGGRYKVEVDSVAAKEINPLDQLLYDKPEKAYPAEDREKSIFYLGTYESGHQIMFSVYRQEVKKTEKETKKETSLNKEFLTETLQKGKEQHKKVNLANILNSDSHPNESFWVKMKVENTEKNSEEDKDSVTVKTTHSTMIDWKPYEEIFTMYNNNAIINSTVAESPVKSWNKLGAYSFHVPKRYRFRIQAGFSTAKVEKASVSIQSRVANTGDIEGLNTSDFQLGFRPSQFRTDTTKLYRIEADGSIKSREINPVIMLSVHPFNRKSLASNTSLFGIISNRYTFGDFISQSISLHVGTSLNAEAFNDYYAGGSIELIEGLDIGLSLFTHNVSKIKPPFEFRDEPLDGSDFYFTNGTIPETGDFLSTERAYDFSYFASVDAIVFQKAFSGIFNAIKKGVTGS